VFVDCFIKRPIELTRTLPEFDQVILISNEEFTKFVKDGHCMDLVRMWWQIKDFLGPMNGISDNDNFGNVFLIWGLVYTTPDCKEFCFSASDKNSMIKSFDQWTVEYVCVWNGCSNVVLDTSICDNNGYEWGIGWLNNHIVKLLEVYFIIFFFIT